MKAVHLFSHPFIYFLTLTDVPNRDRVTLHKFFLFLKLKFYIFYVFSDLASYTTVKLKHTEQSSAPSLVQFLVMISFGVFDMLVNS